MRPIHRFAPLALLALGAPALAGDELAPPVRLTSAGKPIDTDVGHAAPFVWDADGDGKPDLLVGQFGEGKLKVFRNTGTREEPAYAGFEWFQAGGQPGKVESG